MANLQPSNAPTQQDDRLGYRPNDELDHGLIHIALTFDANFWAPAYAVIRSICLSSLRRTDLVFHLCHRPLRPDQVKDLLEIQTEFGASLKFYDITTSVNFNDRVGRLPYDARLTNIVYARLLFDVILPSQIQRLIYLDCDMMVMAPIENLWTIDLESKTLGAVPDSWGKFVALGRDIRQNRDLFDPAKPYFNAGLLLIDMEKWRAARVAEKMALFAEQGIMDRIYYDQDVLNIVFVDDFHPIDRRWNVIEPKPAHEAIDVYLLHYVGHAKPWNLISNVAFFRMYRHVMTNRIFYKFFRHRLRRRVTRFLPFLKS